MRKLTKIFRMSLYSDLKRVGRCLQEVEERGILIWRRRYSIYKGIGDFSFYCCFIYSYFLFYNAAQLLTFYYCAFSRDEIYGYGPKFVRDRFQDHSFGSSRGNFMCVRGRGWGRGRYSGRDFERFGGVADYPSRHTFAAPTLESTNGRNDYDGPAFGTNRRRNPLNYDLP